MALAYEGFERKLLPLVGSVHIYKSHPGVTRDEFFALARYEDRGFASNARFEQLLLNQPLFSALSETFPVILGTYIAYGKPDEKLGQALEYNDFLSATRFVVPVPGYLRKEKNIAMVFGYPDYGTMEFDGNKNSRLFTMFKDMPGITREVYITMKFHPKVIVVPPRTGVYRFVDADTKIPAESGERSQPRFFVRMCDGYVGPIIRGEKLRDSDQKNRSANVTAARAGIKYGLIADLSIKKEDSD